MEKQNDVKPRPRVRLANALRLFGSASGIEVDEAVRARLFNLSDDEFNALLQRIANELSPILRGGGRAPAQDVDAMMSGFADWQHQRPPFYHRTDEQMAAIRRKLVELGPGAELVPLYALSVGVKLPRTGRLILINNRGEETTS